MIIIDYGGDRTEIDDYGRLYGVGDNIYGDLMEALDNTICVVKNYVC